MGYEESYGYLAGEYARDKDAVVASALVCEMAAYYKDLGKTLYDAPQDLYKEYGFFQEGIQSYAFEGVDGKDKMHPNSVSNELVFLFHKHCTQNGRRLLDSSPKRNFGSSRKTYLPSLFLNQKKANAHFELKPTHPAMP